jgi:phosphoserine phosphatase
MKAPRLAIFDLDSTLLDGRTILHLGEHFGVLDKIEAIWAHNPEDEVAAGVDESRRISELFAGVDVQEFDRVCRSVPLRPGAQETVDGLRRMGFVVGVASASYDVAVRAAQERLGLDRVAGAELVISNGRVTGRLRDPTWAGPCGHFICKENVLSAWKAEVGATFTIGAGDGVNDVCLLETADLGVAVEPAHPAARAAADAAVTDLRDILRLARDRLGEA